MINKLLIALLLLSVLTVKGQENDKNPFSVNPEILVGATGESNTDFPERGLQKQALVHLGWHHQKKSNAWKSFIKTSKSGISLGYTDFANKEALGEVFTIQPFLEFNTFKSKKTNIYVGTGIAYVTKKYDPITNEFNKAVSTDLNWSFRIFMYYNVLEKERLNWRIGGGVSHYSNGHSRLPNQGYNSLLLSLGLEINTSKETIKNTTPEIAPEKTISNYYTIRTGLGMHAFSKAIDDKKGVYTISGEYGKIYNKTLKIGFGTYFRFYNSYYDYIVNNESLVQDNREFSYMKSKPFVNALNIAITANGEVLLNHFGIATQIGISFYRPGYEIDWRVNQGWNDPPRVIPETPATTYTLGDTSRFQYKTKRMFSARLGLKYYLIGTNKTPTNNIFLGGFINSNLGQADFTELAIGYMKTFKTRSR